MNKKLIALAIAAAIAPAAAMADSGNVTVYGVAHASYDNVSSGTGALATSTQRVTKVSNNSSRLGFKGNEDVGNGLSAVWQMEMAYDLTDGAAVGAAARNTFVGLSSKTMGTVILGNHDTPYKLSTRGLDVFADTLADNRTIMGGGGKQTIAFDGRDPNVIAYMSPTMGGMSGAIAYVAGAEGAVANGSNKGSAWSLMGMYDQGPITGALAYEKHSFGTAGTGTLGVGTTNKSEKAWKLGAGYKMDAFKVGFVYEKTSDDNTVTGAELSAHKAYTLNGAYNFGSNAAKLAYTKAGDVAGVSQTGAKQWALGLDHSMSKRTTVYALYTKLNNDTAGTWNLGTNTSAGGTITPANGTTLTGAGAAQSAISLGMRHNF